MGECPSGWLKWQTSCYKALPQLYSQPDCARKCRALNASLICVTSEAKNEFIMRHHEFDNVWLGLYHSEDTESISKKDWRWRSGCQSNYSAWGLGEPMKQEYFMRSDCAFVRRGAWRSDPCTIPSSCLCEGSSPGMREIDSPSWIEAPPLHMGNFWKSALSVVLVFACLSASVILVEKFCNQAKEEEPVGDEGTVSKASQFKRNREANKRKVMALVLRAGLLNIIVSCVILMIGAVAWFPAWICGAWLGAAGVLMISTTDLDLNQFFNAHPHMFRSVFVAIALVFGILALVVDEMPIYVAAAMCLPAFYGLCCLKHVQRLHSATAGISVLLVLEHLARGMLQLVRYSSAYYRIMGCVRLLGSICIALVWYYAKRARRMDFTRTFWLVVYTYVGCEGASLLAAQLHNTARSTAVHLFVLAFAPWAFLPPLVFMHRKRIFSLVGSRFERKQRLDDGAFLAALLYAPHVEVGHTYWLHLDEQHKQLEFNKGDHRHNFKRCVVTDVVYGSSNGSGDNDGSKPQDSGFWVRPLESTSSGSPEVTAGKVSMAERTGSSMAAQTGPRSFRRASFLLFRERLKHSDVMPLSAAEAKAEWVCTSAHPDAAELLAYGQTKLRCVDWELVSLELFVPRVDDDTKNRGLDAAAKKRWEEEMYALSRPLQASKGEKKIDFFVSHSWHDDGAAKYCALQVVAEEFNARHGRYPTLWLDAVCFDQRDLSNSLRVLPVNIQACAKVLVLCGETYATRLWCIWELYVVFAFAPKEQAAARVQLQPVYAGGESGTVDVPLVLSHFKLSAAQCYDPNEQAKIHGIIHECGEDQFESHIREVGLALSKPKDSRNRLERSLTFQNKDGRRSREKQEQNQME